MKLNRNECASVFGVTPVTITNWMNDGLPHKKLNKRDLEIDSVAAIEWYIEKQYGEIKKANTTKQDAEYYDAEYRKYKAELMKHKALKEKRELITIDEADEAMTHRLIQIRDQLTNIPLSWSPYLVSIDSNKEAQEKLQDLLEELMNVLSGLADPEYNTEITDDDIDDEDIEDIENIKG